jgi:hypothetical protein
MPDMHNPGRGLQRSGAILTDLKDNRISPENFASSVASFVILFNFLYDK